MKAVTRTRAVGGSLVVTIPKEIVKEESLRKGEAVEITISKLKKKYFGIFKDMRPFTEEDKLQAHEINI